MVKKKTNFQLFPCPKISQNFTSTIENYNSYSETDFNIFFSVINNNYYCNKAFHLFLNLRGGQSNREQYIVHTNYCRLHFIYRKNYLLASFSEWQENVYIYMYTSLQIGLHISNCQWSNKTCTYARFTYKKNYVYICWQNIFCVFLFSITNYLFIFAFSIAKCTRYNYGCWTGVCYPADYHRQTAFRPSCQNNRPAWSMVLWTTVHRFKRRFNMDQIVQKGI